MTTQEENDRVAKDLLADIAAGRSAPDIALRFSPDVEFEIAGDTGCLPWIGQQSGRAAAEAFFRDGADLLERIRFNVSDILSNDDKAVVIGNFTTRIKATGRLIDSEFVLILTVTGGKISRFQMLEDSFAVSRAARA